MNQKNINGYAAKAYEEQSILKCLIESHLLIKQLLSIANDIWHTVLSDCDFTAVDPLPQDIGSTFVRAGILAQGVQLLLKVLD